MLDATPEPQGTSTHPVANSEEDSSSWRNELEGRAPGAIGCVFCAHQRFRRSRMRLYDLKEALMLRYPMRCMRCNQRQYGYFLTAAFALTPKSQSTRIAQGADTWKAWTESEMNGHKLQRPMTTTIGTRATKLQPLAPDSSEAEPRKLESWRSNDHGIW